MKSVETKDHLWFLEDGGSCGKLIRNFNWTPSSVGNPFSWPQSLRTSVDVMLHSKFPMMLWWGDELIQFYNDAFIPNFGISSRHPQAIGATAPDTWPEIWDFVEPIVSKVKEERSAVWVENQPLSILRNGRLEESYWSISYGPVRDESGAVAGIMIVCQETADLINTVEQLQESETMLRNTADRLQLAMEAGKMGAFDMDLTTGKIDSNSQCKRNFGLPPDHAFNFEELLDIIVKEDRPAMQASFENSLHGHSFYDAQYRIRTKAGEIRWIHACGNTVFDSTGKAIKLIGITQEITGQKEFSEQLKRQVKAKTAELALLNGELTTTNQQLVYSNQELSQYAYVASHDLQEPLRKILVYANLITSKAELPEKQKNWAVKIQQSSERMSRLITDLLVFSKLSEDDRRYAGVDLNDVLESVLIDFEILIQDKQADILIDNMPVIDGVALQMNQLFANLLSNALKFTVQGRKPVIRVSAELLSADQVSEFAETAISGTTYYRISFSDNGVGFDDSYAEQVFEVFKRLHANESYPGSGIGLALCKRIVNNHHGNIFVHSQPGSGTAFHMILPTVQPR